MLFLTTIYKLLSRKGGSLFEKKRVLQTDNQSIFPNQEAEFWDLKIQKRFRREIQLYFPIKNEQFVTSSIKVTHSLMAII
jgi:hypothetical protein